MHIFSSSLSFFLLRQAAGSGYVFGAYTAVSWPKSPIRGKVTVADPSGTSFIFSLVNKLNHPLKLNLIDNTRAIELSEQEAKFGGTHWEGRKLLKYSNLVLFYWGKQLNENNGVCYNAPRVNEQQAYQFDQLTFPNSQHDFSKDYTIFGGRKWFAAAEMEVYSL